MGFLITFIVVTAICVVIEARRHSGYWTGVPCDGCLVRVRGWPRRRVEIGVPIAGAADFRIRRETVVDKWSKEFDLAVELQTGHAAFDRNAYVLSDDESVHDILERDARLASAIAVLLRGAGLDGFRPDELVCRAGTLRAAFVATRAGAPVDAVVDWAGPQVRTIGAAVPALPPHRINDPGLARSIALLGVAMGLALNGLLQVGLLAVGALPVTMDTWPLVKMAAGVGVLVAIGLGGLATLALHRTARAHDVLFEVLAIGFVGGMATAFAGLHELNRSSDDAPPRRVAVAVVDAWPIPAPGGGLLALSVADRQGEKDATRTLVVPRAALGAVERADPLALVVRSGYFGVRWIEAVERVAAAADPAPDGAAPAADTLELTDAQWARCRIAGAPAPSLLVVVDGRPVSADGRPVPVPPLVEVAVDVSRPVTLLLTAPEYVQWRIVPAPGARIDGVLASGRYAHTVSGLPDGAPLLVRATSSGDACGRSWLETGTLTLPLATVTERIFGRAHDAVVRVAGNRAVVDDRSVR